MKNNLYIIAGLVVISIFGACRSEEGIDTSYSGELTFAADVQDTEYAASRALGDDFFVTGSLIDVSLQTNKAGAQIQNFAYSYGADRVFRGTPSGFRFTLDDDYVSTLTAYWPQQSVRNAASSNFTDQRQLENFKLSDWMQASASAQAIMPTDAPVSLVFERENTMLEFELVGQNTQGLAIRELLIELQVNNQSTAYWAYCGDPSGHALLILKPGTRLESTQDYLIGRVTVDEDSPYTIIFPQTSLVLEAGKRYLVTLTPQGYYMTAYIFIGGFNDGEDGIGIPFQQPIPDVNGSFTIDTPLQLITMSYLIRNYSEGTPSFDWPSRRYILSDTFQMTAEYAAQYIPVPKSLFSGIVVLENGDNTPVTSVTYTGASGEETLELFSAN